MMSAPVKERGAVLVAVLWVVTVMTLLVVSLGRDVRSNADLARVEIDRLQSHAILESAIDVAAAKLLATSATSDELTEKALLGSATVEMRAADASGLIDISKVDPEFLRSVFDKIMGPGVDSVTLADAVLKRRSDSAATTGRLPFQSIDEVYELLPQKPEAVDQLMPLIGLYSKDGRLNARSSPAILIESVPGITQSDADQIASLRRGHASDAAFRDILVRYGKYLTLAPGSIYSIEARITGGAHVIAGSSIRAVIALDRESRDVPFQVVNLSW